MVVHYVEAFALFEYFPGWLIYVTRNVNKSSKEDLTAAGLSSSMGQFKLVCHTWKILAKNISYCRSI